MALVSSEDIDRDTLAAMRESLDRLIEESES